MNNIEIKARAEKEQNRINDLLSDAGISDRRMKILKPIILNTAWMKAKLDDAMEAIKNSNIVITYDNGGGQKGIRENPLFKGYEALWKSYMLGMNKILDSLPPEATQVGITEDNKPQNVLSIIRAKHREEA